MHQNDHHNLQHKSLFNVATFVLYTFFRIGNSKLEISSLRFDQKRCIVSNNEKHWHDHMDWKCMALTIRLVWNVTCGNVWTCMVYTWLYGVTVKYQISKCCVSTAFVFGYFQLLYLYVVSDIVLFVYLLHYSN